jgi:hypothetical protein
VVIRAVLNAFLRSMTESRIDRHRSKNDASNELHPLSHVDLKDFILLCQTYGFQCEE